MTLSELSKEWKCLVAIVVGAATLCGIAIGADSRYAKQVDLKQLQLAQNYNNFQMRLDSLRATCEKNPCTAETLRTIEWLEKQIRLIEKEMESSK